VNRSQRKKGKGRKKKKRDQTKSKSEKGQKQWRNLPRGKTTVLAMHNKKKQLGKRWEEGGRGEE